MELNETSAIQFPDGAIYEEFMGRWSRLQGRTFLDWCQLPRGLAWIDVGCGNGAFTEEILSRAAPSKVEALDPSPGQISYAKSRSEAKMAHFQVGDAMALPFENATFDVATMALVIAFVPDAVKAIAEMKRVTRAGGMVAAYMWDMPAFKAPLGPLTMAMKDLGIETPRLPSAQASKRDEMDRIWKQVGLRDVETRELPIEISYPSFDNYWATLNLPMGPNATVMRSIAPERLAELRARLYGSLSPRPDGSIVISCLANAVKGRV